MKQTILQKWKSYWDNNQIAEAIDKEEPLFFNWMGVTADLIYPSFEEEQTTHKVLQLLKYFKSQNKNYGQEGFPQTKDHFSLELEIICSFSRTMSQAKMCLQVFGIKAIPGLTEAISKQLAEIDENPNCLTNALDILKCIKKYKLSKARVQELARRIRDAANVPMFVLPALRLLEVSTQVKTNTTLTELCNQIIDLNPDWQEVDPLIFWTTFSTQPTQLESKVMHYRSKGLTTSCLAKSQPFIYGSAKLLKELNLEFDVDAVYKVLALLPDNVETCLKACNTNILKKALGQCARSNIHKLSKKQRQLVLQFIPKEAAQQIMENRVLLAKESIDIFRHIVNELSLRDISLTIPDLSYCTPSKQQAIIEEIESQKAKKQKQEKVLQSEIQLT